MLPAHIKDAIHHYLPPMNGWTVPERGCEMAELVIESRPKLCVELGIFAGRSMISQAMALRENGFGIIYGIDPWRMDAVTEQENTANKDWWQKLDLELFHRETMQAIWGHRLEQFAVVIRSESQHCAELFHDIDILNIDGNHSEIASTRDVRMYMPRVRKGGYIWMDDCDWASTRLAQQILEEHCTTEKVSPDGHYKLYRKK